MSGHIRCCYCGRVTLNPAAYIGAYPVGPTCARKYLPSAAKVRKRLHAVRFMATTASKASTAQRDAKTMDLFEGAPA